MLLNSLFFCNNYRILDTGTIFFQQSLQPKRTLRQVLWSALIYRLINRMSLFQDWANDAPRGCAIPSESEMVRFRRWLLLRAKKGGTIFSGAHQCMGLKRFLTTMEEVLNDIEVLCKEVAGAASVKEVHSALSRVANVGSFFAWQITCDLIESKVVNFGEDDWASLTCGSELGLKYIFGDKCCEGNKVSLAQLLREKQEVAYTKSLKLKFPKVNGAYLSLKDMEHALCEFYKYVQFSREGTGRVRLYSPLTDKGSALKKRGLDNTDASKKKGVEDKDASKKMRSSELNQPRPSNAEPQQSSKPNQPEPHRPLPRSGPEPSCSSVPSQPVTKPAVQPATKPAVQPTSQQGPKPSRRAASQCTMTDGFAWRCRERIAEGVSEMYCTKHHADPTP